MNQNLTKQSKESAVTLNKISIQEFKTQQEQQGEAGETWRQGLQDEPCH